MRAVPEAHDERLAAVARVAEAVGAHALAEEARATAARLDEGLFYVAVLGQFKRGKSTLINALVGHELLPAGVAPVTSVVTVVRYGPAVAARATFRGGAIRDLAPEEIGGLVAEAENPSNRKGVDAVALEVPSPLLRFGLCLADTPGLGSTHAANTAETRAFLPHVDAAILVIGADPPITGDELALLRDLADRVHTVLVVLAKADRADRDELAEATQFSTRAIAGALRRADVRVFEVSAREVLSGLGPTREWGRLTHELEALARRARADLIERARERETRAITARTRRLLDELEGALTRPVAETEARVQLLAEASRAADRALMELRHIFDAEQRQIERDLDARLAAFVDERRPSVRAAIAQGVAEAPARAHALRVAQAAAETAIRDARDVVTPAVEAAFAQAAASFVARAGAIAATVDTAGGEVGLVLELDTTLRARSRFHFLALMTEARPSLGARIAERLRGADPRASTRAATAFADRLLHVNANRVANDLVERMIESRRGLEAALRKHLDATAAAARDAAARARAVQAAGAAAVEAELCRLAALRAQLGD